MQTTYNEFIPLVSQLNHFDKLRLAQWLINTITIEESKKNLSNLTQDKNNDSLKGVFNQYADTSKIALEKSAWQNHVLNKYRHD
jgi:dsDNA-specific endonuclease/ATPase MutS2